ncbi:MAG: RNA polymerase sigma-70 factor [Bacteroidetes bacterium]|nr:RNA polymerase sigma-70 factor [Bacteroidota bacterium]
MRRDVTSKSIDNEKDLLKQIADGSEVAFRQLFDACHQQLFTYVYKVTRSRELADDAVQDIFLKIWSMRQKLPAIENIQAYLRRMAHNLALKGFQAVAREGLIEHQLARQQSPQQAADDGLLSREVQRQINQLIDQLTPSQRKVFLLSREEGLKQQEIADRLGLNLVTVKRHMVDALKVIREGLSQHYGTQAVVLFIIFRLSEH